MSRLHRRLGGASALALSLYLTPAAAAQDATAGTGPSTPATSQAAPDTVGGEIVVTGVRASLSSAQAIKRNARQIVDSVVAEDIGKLPDNNVVEALQRVPGVQVSPRFRGESSTVLVRGLPDVLTVINGRNIFSTTGRSLSLADVPADLVAGVDVYKSRSANQIEGGIAGLINVRTRRPFDFDGSRFAMSARGVYAEQADALNPYISALLSDRWSTGMGEIGALVALSYQRTDYRDQTIFNGGYFGYNLDNSRAPYTPGVPLDPRGTGPADPRVFHSDVIGGVDAIGRRERPAVNAALQWAPDDRLTIFFDGLFYGFRDIGNGDQNFTSMNGRLAEPMTFVEDTKLVERISLLNNRVANYGITYHNHADRMQGALGAEWDNGGLSITSEVSYTRSKAEDRDYILDIDFLAQRTDGFFDRSIGTPTFTLPFDDASDFSKYYLARLNLTETEALGEEYTWRGDVTYSDPLWIFTELTAGARLNQRDATSRSFVQNVNCSATGAVPCYTVRADSIPGLLLRKPGGFFEGRRPFIQSWVSPSTDYLLDNIDVLRERFGLPGEDPAFEDRRFFDIKEKSYAGYAQASFELGNLDGQAGLRIVKVDTVSNAFRTVRNTLEPVRIASNSTDVLPNIALRYRLADGLFVRAAASKTITRPSFAQLNPALTLTPPVPGQQPFGRGSSGNAELQPVESTNYDLAVEWYIDASSSITATLFHRDVTGFIQSVTSNFQIDYLGPDNGTYQISRPENSGTGKLTGIEGGFTYFPPFLDGFGVSANGTYIDGKNRALAPLPGVTGFLTLPFANVSKYSASGTLIYEKDGLSARASYVWRDAYSTGLHFTGVNPNDFRRSPVQNLDLSIAYDLNPNITVVFDATNITNTITRTYFGDEYLYPRDTVLFTRTFALGFRARL